MTPQVEAAWIAAVGGLAGAVVGIAGTTIVAVLGYRNTRTATDKTIIAGAENVRAQIEADRNGQRRDRLAEAYKELGMYLSRHADWARSVEPFIGAPTPPEPIKPEELWGVETLVRLYGSGEVGSLLDEWAAHARNVGLVGTNVHRLRESAGLGGELVQQRLALDNHKAAMRAADEAIRAQMNRELAAP